jgi:predicted Zn-dependent protease
MVTADLPFQQKGKPVGQFIAEVCRGKPKAPADISNVPNDLSDIILWAMHHEVAQRCQSAKELRQALEKVHASLEGEEADLPTCPPESPEIDRLIAEAWKEHKSQALELALKNIIAHFPDQPKGYCSLAEFYNKQLLVRQAIQVLEEGRRRCLKDSKLLMNLAAGYYATKQQQRALDTLREASRLSLLPDMKERINVLLNAWGRKA